MMPRKIKYHSHYGNILYMMTSLRRLISIREAKSTKFKRLVTVIAAKLTSHLSVCCNHVLNRLNELQFSETLAQPRNVSETYNPLWYFGQVFLLQG